MKKVVVIVLFLFLVGPVVAKDKSRPHATPTDIPTATMQPYPTWTPTPEPSDTPAPTVTLTPSPIPTKAPAVVQSNRSTGRNLGVGLILLVLALFVGEQMQKGTFTKTSKKFQRF